MKFTCEIEINASLEKVAALWFDDFGRKILLYKFPFEKKGLYVHKHMTNT